MKRHVFLLILLAGLAAIGQAQDLNLDRTARDWEFLGATGHRSALLGKENGTMEAWVFPLKLVSDLRLEFWLNGRPIAARDVVRSVHYRPGSATLVYSGDYFEEHFLVHETLVAPPDRPGAAILLEIETSSSLRVDIAFKRDFTLMWPAGLGGSHGSWDDELHALVMGEGTGRFWGIVGSADARLVDREFGTNYSSNTETRFTLGTFSQSARRAIVLAGSLESRQEAVAAFESLARDVDRLPAEADRYFENYLQGTVRLSLPDKGLQAAYDWSLVSMRKGLVDNPLFDGRGLVAGYGISKGEPRPGFAWFFGRDSFWTCLALTAAGDFETARDAIRFVARFQRDDGKIPHEIAQSAPLIPWFTDYPYAYAAADATSLFVIAVADYAKASGDRSLLDESWEKLEKAVSFLTSMEDENGFARNDGVGHGWIEGGPLLPVRTEFYQAGLHVQALVSMADLADLRGNSSQAQQLRARAGVKRDRLNQAYWLPTVQRYALAINREGNPVDEASVLATVPMWFGLTDSDKSAAMIPQLAGEDHLSDWGMRIISARSPMYGPAGYHFGSVWPLFTGWASVGEYRHHQTGPAYANLQANAELALDGSGGNTTEVVSGAVYSPLSTSSSHQIWSAAMVVSPLLRGLLGLRVDAPGRTVELTPHLPATWRRFEVGNLPVGQGRVNLAFERDDSRIALEVDNGGAGFHLRFAPALAPRARVVEARISGGGELKWERLAGVSDWHPGFDVEVPTGNSTLIIKVEGDFAVSTEPSLPLFGEPSSNLKILAQTWSQTGDVLDVQVSGRAGGEYRLNLFGGGAVAGVSGGRLADGGATLTLRIPDGDAGYARHTVEFRFKN